MRSSLRNGGHEMRTMLRPSMRAAFLPFATPMIAEEEIDEVVATLRSGWITTGPKVKRFEEEFAAFIHSPTAVAVNSCTAALHLALVVLGVGPGDQVITSPMTFCSSVHVIEHVGARPILVDVEPDTLNIDPRGVEAVVARAARRSRRGRHGGSPVKAVLPVHLYGHPCEMDAIMQIARDHGLAVIEDAAHALPAKYNGRSIGAWPPADGPVSSFPKTLTCFSFYATKNLTTAEGGMLTGAPELLEEARTWSLHGMSRDAWKRYSAEGSWFYEVVGPGFKYNMTDIQASIGLHQLRKLLHFQIRRREIVHRYTSAFSQFEELEPPAERPEIEHAWHLYTLRLNTDRFRLRRGEGTPLAVRNRFIEELAARNIGTSVHFIPIHLHPYYRDKYRYHPRDFPNAYRAYTRLVSLPLYPGMSDADVDDVITAVADIVRRFRG